MSAGMGFIGPLEDFDARCPECGCDPLDVTLHREDCPISHTTSDEWPVLAGPGHEGDDVSDTEKPVPLDPIDATVITPSLTAIPLTPSPWDDLPDGQHAVAPDGVVYERRAGLWHRHPWWQGDDAEEIIAICADPDEWAYGMGWSRKHIEDAHGPLTPITLPGVQS